MVFPNTLMSPLRLDSLKPFLVIACCSFPWSCTQSPNKLLGVWESDNTGQVVGGWKFFGNKECVRIITSDTTLLRVSSTGRTTTIGNRRTIEYPGTYEIDNSLLYVTDSGASHSRRFEFDFHGDDEVWMTDGSASTVMHRSSNASVKGSSPAKR